MPDYKIATGCSGHACTGVALAAGVLCALVGLLAVRAGCDEPLAAATPGLPEPIAAALPAAAALPTVVERAETPPAALPPEATAARTAVTTELVPEPQVATVPAGVGDGGPYGYGGAYWASVPSIPCG